MTQPTPKHSSDSGAREVIVLLKLRFKPGTRDQVWRTMGPAVLATRAEEGNDEYVFFEVNGAADEYVVLERWRDQAALDRHMQQPHMESVLALLGNSLAFPMAQIPEHRMFLEEVR